MKKDNIPTVDAGQFSWNDGERLTSLDAAFFRVRIKLDNAIAWYQVARAGKRTLGAFTRYAAILLGIVAAAWPTITEMALEANARLSWWERPGIATVFGVIVGGLLVLDRFSGGTSGWIRYTMAETALKELRDELILAYTLEQGQWAGQKEPSIEQTLHALAMLNSFLSRGNQVVRNETDQWKTEFQSALQQTDEFARAQPSRLEVAAGVVRITNPERLADKWFVSFNDGPDQEVLGDSKAFRITPGSVLLRVTAKIKSDANPTHTRIFKTEVAETLVVGAPKAVAITLPQA